jgi:hypothetical protein
MVIKIKTNTRLENHQSHNRSSLCIIIKRHRLVDQRKAMWKLQWGICKVDPKEIGWSKTRSRYRLLSKLRGVVATSNQTMGEVISCE